MIFLLFMGIVINTMAASDTFTLKVKIENLSSSDGKLLYLLFDRADGFPEVQSTAIKEGELDALTYQEGIVFSGLKVGQYAVSIIHDENNNKKLDTNFIGIPTESFGFSNNPMIFFGPPSFKKCSVKVEMDQEITIKLKRF